MARGFWMLCAALAVALSTAISVPPSWAQGTEVTLGAAEFDRNAPVEIDADMLDVDRDSGLAVFSGNVQVSQGALRLQADAVTVNYDQSTPNAGTEIREVRAEGNVLMVSGPDAAESQLAVFRPASNEIRMTGDVLLSQGPVLISGDALVLNLTTGIGQMEGRVRTVLQPQ